MLAVEDRQLPENNLTLRLSPAGVAVTAEPADARVDVATLAAAYLGGTKWWQLAAAGRVQAADATTIGRLDALFAVDALPHAGTMF